MPRTSSGTFTRVSNSFSEPVFGTVIDPTDAIDLWNDYDDGLSDSLSRTGDGPMEADLDMDGFGIVNTSGVELVGSSSGSTLLKASAVAGSTILTLPAATDTLVGKATTDTFTNKTFNTVSTGNSLLINSLAATANTGTGAVVRATSATLIGPVIIGGTVTVVSTSSLSLKGSSSGATLLKAQATASGTITVPSATDTLMGKATTDTLTNKTFDTAGTGNSFSINSLAVTANSGTGAVVRATSATLIGPVIVGGTVTVVNTSTISLKGSSSGATLLKAQASASGTITIPSATDTLVGKATTDTLTNKTFDTAGSGNSLSINGVAVTANSGTGAVVRVTSATLITPNLGVARATSLNGNTFTTGTYTLTGAASKTLTFSNSITLAGTDSTTMTFPATSSNVMTTGNSTTSTVGYLFTSYNGGTVSSGTYTPAAANGNYQYYTNNGAHTLANPAADSAIDILITNGASAGAITFTTFTVGSSTGDALTTTNTNKFIISIRRINGVSTYVVKALQ